jgi:hypothetical protein
MRRRIKEASGVALRLPGGEEAETDGDELDAVAVVVGRGVFIPRHAAMLVLQALLGAELGDELRVSLEVDGEPEAAPLLSEALHVGLVLGLAVVEVEPLQGAGVLGELVVGPEAHAAGAGAANAGAGNELAARDGEASLERVLNFQALVGVKSLESIKQAKAMK